MGKRVNFSARSVITPDPIMDVHEVGVPYGVATTLTVPERVTPANINDLHQRVLRGAGQLNGAEYIMRVRLGGVSFHVPEHRRHWRVWGGVTLSPKRRPSCRQVPDVLKAAEPGRCPGRRGDGGGGGTANSRRRLH